MVDLELLRAAPLIDVVWFSIEFQEVQLDLRTRYRSTPGCVRHQTMRTCPA